MLEHDSVQTGREQQQRDEPADIDLAHLYANIAGDAYYTALPEGDIGSTGQAKIVIGHPQHRGAGGVLVVKIRLDGRILYRTLVCHDEDEIGNVRECPDVVWRRFTGCGTTVFFESSAEHCSRPNGTARDRASALRAVGSQDA